MRKGGRYMRYRRRRRTQATLGIVLILIGVLFLMMQFLPGMRYWFALAMRWPFIFFTLGLGLMLFGLLVDTPDMMIPACVLCALGLIFSWQDFTVRWRSWAFLWPLLPAAVGIGQMLAGALKRKRKEVWEGFRLTVISVVLIALLSSIFRPWRFSLYWPVLLIVLGVWLLIRNLFGRR